MKVVHLLPSALQNHGPTGGVLAQAHHGPESIETEVWGMYPAPPNKEVVSAPGVTRTRCLEMSRRFYDVRALPRLVGALREAEPDVLHTHLLRAGLYGRVAARAAGVPVVVHHYRQVEEWLVSPAAWARSVRLAERATAAKVGAFVCVSEAVRQAVLRELGFGADRVRTILNAVDIPSIDEKLQPRAETRARLGIADDELCVGVLAVLESRKNVPALVRAVASIRESTGLPIKLRIGGDGRDRSEVEAAIDEVDGRSWAEILGFVHDIGGFLPALDLFALPSLSEGLPRAVMEALVSGIPVVASDAGGTAEAVDHGETGFVFSVGDDAAMTTALRDLLTDPGLRERFGARASVVGRERFAPRRLADDHARLYEGLLRGRAQA